MLFQIIFVCNFNIFHAALYHIANNGKTKREYSNCTGNEGTAAYTLLQMTKVGSLPDIIRCCDGTWKYKARNLHHSSVTSNRKQYFSSNYVYITVLQVRFKTWSSRVWYAVNYCVQYPVCPPICNGIYLMIFFHNENTIKRHKKVSLPSAI
jgi:hypothetical protein